VLILVGITTETRGDALISGLHGCWLSRRYVSRHLYWYHPIIYKSVCRVRQSVRALDKSRLCACATV